MKLKLIVLLFIGALLVGVTSPAAAGSVQAASAQSHPAAIHQGSHTNAFDKTRFVAHMAFAAFLVHYIYKKYKQGKLGRTHLFTDIKAAAAALLAAHEIKKSYDIAKSSKSATLQALVAPISALMTAASNEYHKLLHGDTSAVTSASTSADALSSVAAKNGFAFKDAAQSGYNPGF